MVPDPTDETFTKHYKAFHNLIPINRKFGYINQLLTMIITKCLIIPQLTQTPYPSHGKSIYLRENVTIQARLCAACSSAMTQNRFNVAF